MLIHKMTQWINSKQLTLISGPWHSIVIQCIFPITVYCWDIQQINLFHYLWKFYRTISALLCNSKSIHLHVGYMLLETLSIHRLKTSLCHIDVHTTSFFSHGALWVRLKDGKIFFSRCIIENWICLSHTKPELRSGRSDTPLSCNKYNVASIVL